MEVKESYNFWRRARLSKASYANDRRRLNRKLKKAGYQFTYHKIYDGYQWILNGFPNGDIIIHCGSYSNRYGHFESMGMPWDNGDCTECTANEIIEWLKTGRE